MLEENASCGTEKLEFLEFSHLFLQKITSHNLLFKIHPIILFNISFVCSLFLLIREIT